MLALDESSREDFDISFVFDDFAEEVLRFTFPICAGTSTVAVTRGELQSI